MPLALLFMASITVSRPAFASDAVVLPAVVKFLPSFGTVDQLGTSHLLWAETPIPAPPAGDPRAPRKKGEYWKIALDLPPPPPPMRPSGASVENNEVLHAAWQRLQPGFSKAGWILEREYDQKPYVVSLHYQNAMAEAWAAVTIADPATATVEIVRSTPQPLSPPAPEPEIEPEVKELARALERDCHVALTGVLFDFNKATLKHESDVVLTRVLRLLTLKPGLVIQVQGHTDNVGGADYNMALSEARAKAVGDWLLARGVAPGRVTTKGFGLTMPVAGNDTEEDRARNRRVELAKAGCSPK